MMSETRTCSGRGPDMFGKPLWNLAEESDNKAKRSDISGYCFYNPVFGLDKSSWDLVADELELGQTCPTWGLDMSRNSFWNQVRNPDMSGFSGNFGLWTDLDVLHFTNSLNATPLIVRSS
jgi:hypothetical protein